MGKVSSGVMGDDAGGVMVDQVVKLVTMQVV